MWHNVATQANVALVRSRGIEVLEPDEGLLASGITGRGRLPTIDSIEGALRALLGRTYGRMAGRTVVVTAGGTHEPLDPVRFIGNRASGQMGYALAASARDEGARVVLISGPATATEPAAVELISVETAQQMHDAVHAAIGAADLLIMNAAVADYRPAESVAHKLKKTDSDMALALERTPDILLSLRDERRPIKVGFAAETQELLAYASDKLARKRLDLIVANDAVSSIGQPEIQVTLISADGAHITLPRLAKALIAEQVLDHVIQRWPDRLGRIAAPERTPSMRFQEE
jgi:phosphopantothenoylcysteine decarboxylase/phosphopantothenate--cysteine ligase